MADARTLLRQQRAARQQAQKPQKQSPAPAAAPVSKKRKATDTGSEERKRTRTEEAAGVPAGFFDTGVAQEEEEIPFEPPSGTVEDNATQLQAQERSVDNAPPPVDLAAEAELDAFMNEMAKPKPPQPPTIHNSSAVIEAAPMTAAELAAKAREEQSAQRAQRDEEMEGEKEDAARALEDEFEEMEGLEERVKRLREQREALRQKPSIQILQKEKGPAVETPDDEDMDSDSDDDEDWEDWRFRPA